MALKVYNTMSGKKEEPVFVSKDKIGMYVCGITAYDHAHIGHARALVSFDAIYRYLKFRFPKSRVVFVRNITDVGHLENDADEGEDKIVKKARLEKLEPMEVVQYFTDRYHENMKQLNVKSPSIEPRASGHIIEQIEMVKKIVDSGFAYEVNGSLYFDVKKYNENHNYGKLSGRKIEDLISNTRTLQGQDEKKNPYDFALWKKAQPEHIMRWPSPWSDGFPGWHMECSAMGTKYLGNQFDIHGGGMDLLFPHHESEIAQSQAANGNDPVKYWIHNNMITIDGQKMGKSLNNFITLEQFFTGNHETLDKAYSPMTIRFFILQAHYGSTVDFSNSALLAAEKGMKKMMTAIATLDKLKASDKSSVEVKPLQNKCYDAMNDDFNSPIVISHLFDGVKMINSIKNGKNTISEEDLILLKKIFNDFAIEILGLQKEESAGNNDLVDKLMETILSIRKNAKEQKDYTTADKIRNELNKLNILIKDTKDGASWEIVE